MVRVEYIVDTRGTLVKAQGLIVRVHFRRYFLSNFATMAEFAFVVEAKQATKAFGYQVVEKMNYKMKDIEKEFLGTYVASLVAMAFFMLVGRMVYTVCFLLYKLLRALEIRGSFWCHDNLHKCHKTTHNLVENPQENASFYIDDKK